MKQQKIKQDETINSENKTELTFNLSYQIFDEFGAKDSIITLTEIASTLEDAIQKVENNLKKNIRKNWSFKLIKEN